ncbi:MAG: YicC family protein [Planctomycetes bacterium]|nr:YicC family protein [Planctomycetota bacterium]
MKSMTGFGYAQEKESGFCIEVEVRSYNGRYLKINTTLPDALRIFQQDVELLAKNAVSRGTLEIFISLQQEMPEHISINREAIRLYMKQLRGLKDELCIKPELSLDTILLLPGVLDRNEKLDRERTRRLWPRVRRAVTAALVRFDSARMREGAKIQKHIVSVAAEIAEQLKKIEKFAPQTIKEYKFKLEQRLKKLVDTRSHNLQANELAREIALFADKCDISEETQRISSHLTEFTDILKRSENIGKNLEFIVQELFREANTIASKANDNKIVSVAVGIKNNLEKIKEQVQNIE